jgi:hypothetical protein
MPESALTVIAVSRPWHVIFRLSILLNRYRMKEAMNLEEKIDKLADSIALLAGALIDLNDGISRPLTLRRLKELSVEMVEIKKAAAPADS